MRAALVAIALLATACHHDAPPQVTSEATPSTSATLDSGAAHAKKNSPACALVEAARIGVDAGGHAENVETCLPTKSGVWSALVETVYDDPHAGEPPAITLQLVHADASSIARGDRQTWLKISVLSLFDFDDDGEAELLVHGARTCTDSAEGHCTVMRSEVSILTFKAGRVTSFLNAAPLTIPASFVQSHIYLKDPTHFAEDESLIIDDAIDADGDGRLDLKTHLFYELAVSDGDQSSSAIYGPTFIAHSLAGGAFSLTDEVAMKELSNDCATAPAFDKADSRSIFKTAVCARLAGKGVAEITQRYGARCSQIRARFEKFRKDLSQGKPMDPTVDGDADYSCRTEPEQGWSEVNGIPKAIVKMLQLTQPLLAKP